jgi:hypothetical protein
MSSNPSPVEVLTPPETDRPELYAVPDPGAEAAVPPLGFVAESDAAGGTGLAEVIGIEFVEPEEIEAAAVELAATDAGEAAETIEEEEDAAEKPSVGILKTAAGAIGAAAEDESLSSLYRRGGGGGAIFRWMLEQAKEHKKPCMCYYCSFPK